MQACGRNSSPNRILLGADMSLYGMMRTGVSGMNAQSTRLATVADNIANSGTNGYKKASVEFSSLVAPSSGSSYVSGAASTQVRHLMSSGNLQYTNSITDVAIDGNGFLVVQDAAGKPLLTRAGSFHSRRQRQSDQRSWLLSDGTQLRTRRARDNDIVQ